MFIDPFLLPFFQDSGYTAPSTLAPFSPVPFLEIGSFPEFQEEASTPSEISFSFPVLVRIRFEHVTITPPSPVVQLIVEEDVLSPFKLYTQTISSQLWGHQSQIRATLLICTGEVFHMNTQEWVPLSHPISLSSSLYKGSLMATKTFGYEQTTHVTETRSSHTPTRIFRPFGGMWNETKQDVEQVYYEIGELYPHQTTITLFPRFSVPLESRVFIPSLDEKESSSLSQWIESGGLSFSSQSPVETPYRSTHIHQKSENFWDIVCVPDSE